MPKKIAIAADHAGFEMKTKIIAHLVKKGFEVEDLGAHCEDRVDYPDFGFKLATHITAGKADFGIGVCGSGLGISIALNRYSGIRAALCHDVTMARLSRLHNDANVLCLGGRVTGQVTAEDITDEFFKTAFEGGRHQDRVNKLSSCGAA
jgi:ribose 5-phosphate isomerase B